MELLVAFIVFVFGFGVYYYEKYLSARSKSDAYERKGKIENAEKQIENHVNNSGLSDLVDQSNERYGSRPNDN